jgi:hypothetical protein
MAIDVKRIADSAVDPANELARLLLEERQHSPRAIGYDFLSAGIVALQIAGVPRRTIEDDINAILNAVPREAWPSSGPDGPPPAPDRRPNPTVSELARHLIEDRNERPRSVGLNFACEGVGVLCARAGFTRALVNASAIMMLDSLDSIAPIVLLVRLLRRYR